MELAFSTTTLRKLCEDEGTMVTRLGIENARALKSILADLRALARASELESMHNAFLSPDGHLALPFLDELTINALANHVANPTDSNGHVDWSLISRLKILSIGDNQ